MLDWMQHWYTPRTREEDSEIVDDLLAIAAGGLSGCGLVKAMEVDRDVAQSSSEPEASQNRNSDSRATARL